MLMSKEDGISNNNGQMKHTIDPSKDRFPYCIVWSPLAPITWFLPFIGHTGICNSEGVIFDFAGPYTIGVGRMAFGSPTRYIRLDPGKCREMGWDQAIEEGCEVYSKRMHNICWDNCHNHVGKCLELMAYNNRRYFGMGHIGVWFAFCGSFTSVGAFIKTYLPFTIIALIIFLFKYFT